MNDLEIKQRYFPVSMVKAYASRIYGKISKNAWHNWRSWANVPKGAMLVTFDQFCFIAAIATLRTQHPRRELSRSEVQQIANSLDLQTSIAAVIEFMDNSGTIAGSDAIKALQIRGKRVSLRSLYRKIPAFSLHKFYSIEYLEKLLA